MEPNRRYSIFISHSTKDKAFVEKLRAYLKDFGVDAWLDNYEIIKGQSVPKRIEDGITGSDYFGPVLTPFAASSIWVDHEIDIAIYIWIQELRRERVFIIPILREDCKPRKGICYLAYCDFRDDGMFVSKCRELLDTIQADASSNLKTRQASYGSSTKAEQEFKLTLVTRLRFNATAYINREVVSSEHHRQSYGLFAKDFREDLLSIVLRSKRICLLGEAGKGKTLELERVVHKLATDDLPFVPVYCSLNRYTDQPLDSYVPDVKRFDDEKLVLFLDGFDEIPSGYRENAVRSIKEFCEQHPNARVVLSSRTNLYQDIQGFEVYYLVDLRGEAIRSYVKTNLGKAAPIFEKAVGKAGLADWLHHPFYLVRLVELYLQTGATPETAVQLIEALIDLHLAKDDEKYPQARARRPATDKALERLALTMEILARNYLVEDEFREIVSDDDRAVLARSGLLRKVDGEHVTWQFEHNSFQEFIAARVLSRHDLDVIKEVTSFAPDFAGVKPSWSNTVAFLFSHLAANRDALAAFLHWMKTSAPQLIVRFEPDRIDLSQRMEVFSSIFEDYKTKRILIRSDDYTARDLGRFADSKEAIEYLLREGEATTDSTILVNIVDILRFMTVPYGLQNAVLKLLMSIVERGDKDPHLTAHGLLALADLGYASKDIVEGVIHLVSGSRETWIRSFLYYYLNVTGSADEYVEVFLEGLKYVRIPLDDRNVRLVDESYYLKGGMESITKPAALEKVLKFFGENPSDIQDTFMTDALEIVIENASIAFQKDPTIYDMALQLFVGLHSKHQEKEAEIVRRFFDLTATRRKAFGQLFGYRKADPDWYVPVASMLTEETTLIVVDEYLAGRLPARDIWRLRNFIGGQNRSMYDRYLEIVNEKTGNKFILPPQRDYGAERKKRFREDLELLFDRDRFLESIHNIYVTESKELISEDDLHQLRMKRWDDPTFSELALQTLTDMVRGNPKTFDKVVNTILRSDWDFFTVSKIRDFMSGNRTVELTNEQKAKIEKWCLDSLPKVDFRKALKRRDSGGATGDNKAILLWYFLRKFNLRYPEETLLDMISFDWVDELQMHGIKYLEPMIGTKKMADRVLQNLVDGIDVDNVLKNHLDYCTRYKIREVVPFAVGTVSELKRSEDVRRVALTAICAFEETNSELVMLLLTVTDNMRWLIARALIPRDQNSLRDELRKLMYTGSEYDRARASELLIELQDLEGLNFYVQQAKAGKHSPSDPFEGPVIRKIKTKEAVPLLMDLLKVTLDPKFVQDEYRRIDSAILDALTAIAMDSDYYEEISAEVKKFIDTNLAEFDSVRFLHNFLRTLERTYYMNKAEKYTLAEAAKIAIELVG